MSIWQFKFGFKNSSALQEKKVLSYICFYYPSLHGKVPQNLVTWNNITDYF